MRKEIKPIIPRCGICGKLYSTRDDDGSGLCLKHRPTISRPLLDIKKVKLIKKTKGYDEMDEFNQEQEVAVIQEGTQEADVTDVTSNQENAPVVLKIEDLVTPGRYGVSHQQLYPAIRSAIAENSVEKLKLIKSVYFYNFDSAVKYLKKAERQFIKDNAI